MNPEVFTQAKLRGWMKGSADLDIVGTYTNNSGFLVLQVYFLEQDTVKHYTLNDILFGTDFCSRFFPSECRLPSFECCAEDVTWRSHKKVLAFMSHGERIAFLEQHLEIKDELCEKTEHFNKEGVDIVLKPCNKNGCMVLHTEKNDDRQIEGISEVHIDRINGVDHFSLQTRKDIIVTINQLVKVANAQQKELDNLKINQGGH